MSSRLELKKILLLIIFSLVVLVPALVHAQGTGISGSTAGPAGFGSPLGTLIAEPMGFVYQSWTVTRTIINILLIIALMAISFSNITRINIDTYTIKKALPNLLIGVILANASLFIIRFMSDITTVVTYFFVNEAGSATFADFIGDTAQLVGLRTLESILLTPTTLGQGAAVITAAAPSALLILLFAIVTIVCLLWLTFLMYFRLVSIYLLTILSPLAFVAYGIPGQEKYFKQWWQQFTKWLFIVPAMSAVFWLMLTIGNAGENQSIARLLIMYLLLITALTLPSKMGGAVIDKASKAFMKYTGANAAMNASKEFASTKAQQIGYRLPGVARYQAWQQLQKENAKKDIEQLKKRGRNKVLAGKAGRNYEKLKLLDKEISLNEEEILARQEVAAGNLRGGFRQGDRSISERLLVAEFRKRVQDDRKNENDAMEKLEFLNSSDKEIKDLVKSVFRATIDQEVVSNEVGRAEKMKKGGQATEYLQPLQAGANYKRLKDEYDALDDARKQGAEGQALTAAMSSIEESYNKLRSRDEYKEQFGSMDIGGLLRHLDSDTDEGKTTQGRILQGRHRQVQKMFNEGLAGQIESEVKEQTVPEIERELREFFKDKLKGDITLIRQFLRGDTAALAAATGADGKSLLSANDIRTGLAIAEKQKQLARSTNDIRHQDLLRSIAQVNQEYFEADDPNRYSEDLIRDATSNDVKARRKAAGHITQNTGVFSRQSNLRVQAANPNTPDRSPIYVPVSQPNSASQPRPKAYQPPVTPPEQYVLPGMQDDDGQMRLPGTGEDENEEEGER